jgi:hypothetical protein
MTAAFDFSNLEDQLQDERKKVDVASHDFSVRELVRMLEEGELSISPEYQRKYRWQEDVASTLIESIFLGLPVPPIFVATNAGFQWEVVDGLQRLSTLLFFVANRPEHLALINRTAPLKLQKLQKLSQLNDVGYADLPVTLQRYFGRQPLQVISLTDKSNQSVRFDLFERLNAGAISLSPQEVRACIYGGPFNDFLEELAREPNFQGLIKLQELKQNDGTAAEEVLKFFAYKNNRDAFDGRVKNFLNEFSAASVESFDYERERELFLQTFEFLFSVTNGPFLRNTTSVTPLVQLEACAVAIGELISEGLTPIVPPAGWIEDAELVDSSTGGSNTRAKLNRRMKRAREIFGGQ